MRPAAAAVVRPTDLGLRPSTDVPFLVLFLGCSLLPQLGFASHALGAGLKGAQAAIVELPEGFLQMLGCAMALCMLAGLFLLQLTRCLPVRLLVYGAILGSAGLMACSGVAIGLGLLHEAPASASDAFSQMLLARGGDFLILGAVVELLVVSYFWKELQLSVAVLRTTSAFLWDAPWVALLYPPLFGLAHVASLALWALAVLGAAGLLGAEEGLGRALRERYAVHSALGLLLCYFWGSGFVTALSSFATARLTAEWYFAPPQGKRRVAQPSAALRVITLGLQRHGGSLALGSLLLAILRVLSIFFFWAGRDHQRKEEDSRVRRCWLRAREVAAGCLEGAARFASRQAFVEVAVSGCGFFEGAARAARRVAAAPKRFAAVEGAGALQRAASEVLLIGLAACAAWLLEAERAAGEQGRLAGEGASISLVLPACFGAWLVAESMLHPVSVATATVLHCWLLDGTASADAPHVPAPLRSLLKDGAPVGEEASFVAHYA